MYREGTQSTKVDGTPIEVDTAHFGLTFLRASCVAKIEKPYFLGVPLDDGTWGDGRIDDDIWFWKQWKKAGFKTYVAPDVRIGHLEEMVSMFDRNMQPQHYHVAKWREVHRV